MTVIACKKGFPFCRFSSVSDTLEYSKNKNKKSAKIVYDIMRQGMFLIHFKMNLF